MTGEPEPSVSYPGAIPEPSDWMRVIFSFECEDGDCPVCRADYTECPCPGPTEDGVEYREHEGELQGRRTE